MAARRLFKASQTHASQHFPQITLTGWMMHTLVKREVFIGGQCCFYPGMVAEVEQICVVFIAAVADLLPLPADAACVGLGQTGQDPQQTGFAHTVGTFQLYYITGRNIK
jgi:hypothetical protein